MWNSVEYEKENSAGNCWLDTIVNAYRKYKRRLFGDSRKDKLLDYTVRPNYKLVFAKYKDGFYRPGSLVDRNKKLRTFNVYFYHTKKCLSVQPRNIVLKHDNLLERRVCFTWGGHSKQGTVFGNDSPANGGFPSTFFIKGKRKPKWYKVNFKHVFLSKKQVVRMHVRDAGKRGFAKCKVCRIG
ncbi:unnamed protein product [Phyllotreta striolata]|uniref:Uncharacterized protein n=1 Tax=Phyllotreta striolata TaxID=444603 RepID=A0A9P0DRS2_PHYSR|nr:unnamed protein product [Phyllotreta striolata]